MSRPCFALSVMLCCMGGPLLIIGKAHARDTVVSPSHDPGECIVCPLAHGPLEVCDGYSDYDYNQYWYDDHLLPLSETPLSETTVQTDPELEVAESSTDDLTNEAWDSGYEDYYSDYVFGDDSTTTDADESATTEEYFDSYDSYAPIDAGTAEATSGVDSSTEGADSGDEAYEEEWFSYGAETTVETPEESNPAADEAYEALSESASDPWGDEEEWYRQEYGYDSVVAEEIAEAASDAATLEPLETGYDAAYDEAMVADLSEAEEPAADIPLPDDGTELPEVDDYESFYDYYDDLYNAEPALDEFPGSESSETAIEPEIEERVQLPVAPEPAWLTDLVHRMLSPVWAAAGGIALNSPLHNPDSRTALPADECTQEWDCELDYWARPQREQQSAVLGAADTLDEMASLLQNAAELLRGLASERAADTARATGSGSPR
ncbi:MAG: hypothetical protein O3C40_03430 [Planctomycetota bacterium]|nr:hypothetical protein [Planctomycetota bacterium]